MPLYFTKGDAVASIVTASLLSQSHRAAIKNVADYRGNFAYAIVLLVRPHIERFIVDTFARSFESERNALANIVHMYKWPPWRAIAGHPYLLCRPRRSGKVVKHDIEAHPWTCAEGGRVPQEYRREVGIR